MGSVPISAIKSHTKSCVWCASATVKRSRDFTENTFATEPLTMAGRGRDSFLVEVRRDVCSIKTQGWQMIPGMYAYCKNPGGASTSDHEL